MPALPRVPHALYLLHRLWADGNDVIRTARAVMFGNDMHMDAVRGRAADEWTISALESLAALIDAVPEVTDRLVDTVSPRAEGPLCHLRFCLNLTMLHFMHQANKGLANLVGTMGRLASHQPRRAERKELATARIAISSVPLQCLLPPIVALRPPQQVPCWDRRGHAAPRGSAPELALETTQLICRHLDTWNKHLSILPSQPSGPQAAASSATDAVLHSPAPLQPQINSEQMQAVRDVLGARHGAVPYLVFGPPGTGKTMVALEMILQILIHHDEPRILVCAPSNAAADVIAMRLAKLISAAQVRRDALRATQDAPHSGGSSGSSGSSGSGYY